MPVSVETPDVVVVSDDDEAGGMIVPEDAGTEVVALSDADDDTEVVAALVEEMGGFSELGEDADDADEVLVRLTLCDVEESSWALSTSGSSRKDKGQYIVVAVSQNLNSAHL
jgi:hypothetical protein